MNILTRTYSGHTVVRPDTTWEKDNEDFYPPDFVKALTFTAVIFARVSKPGRSVGRKFASRYYDSVGWGLLLYPENMIDGSPESLAEAICLDHTSFLPAPLFPPEEASTEGTFSVRRNGEVIYEYDYVSPVDGKQQIEEALEEVSRMCYIRTGDIVAVELCGRLPLMADEDGTATVEAYWNGRKTSGFRIVF